jgi:penicillin-binding protein-related factor A (putative recombinase)
LAKEKGLGNGMVITKEDFDYTIKPVLQPYITLNDTFIVEEQDGNNVNHQLKQQNLIAKEWKEKISKLFTLNNEETLKQVISNTQQDEIKNKKSFEKWNLEKSKVKHDREREDVSVLSFVVIFFTSFFLSVFLSFFLSLLLSLPPSPTKVN